MLECSALSQAIPAGVEWCRTVNMLKWGDTDRLARTGRGSDQRVRVVHACDRRPRRLPRLGLRHGDSPRIWPAPKHPPRCPGSLLLWSGGIDPTVLSVDAAVGVIAVHH